MSQLATKIKLYCKEKGVDTVDFTKDVILLKQLDKDAIIENWNLEIAKPTDEQLNALESEAIKLENNQTAITNRQKEYGSLESQIEFITEKGLEAWKTNVQAIKTKYPKENE